MVMTARTKIRLILVSAALGAAATTTFAQNPPVGQIPIPQPCTPEQIAAAQAAGLEPVKIKEVWVMGPLVGDTWVDISETMPRKIEALRAHVSQLGDWDPTEEMTNWATAVGNRAIPQLPLAEEFRSFVTSG